MPIGSIATEADLRTFVQTHGGGDESSRVRQIQGLLKAPPTWVALAPVAGWVASANAPAAARGADGLVQARGWLTKTSAWAPGDRVCQLPIGYRPGAFDRYVTAAANGVALLDVGTDGWVTVWSAAAWTSSTTVMSLAGISFWAEG